MFAFFDQKIWSSQKLAVTLQSQIAKMMVP
jgi:hypothetical protein